MDDVRLDTNQILIELFSWQLHNEFPQLVCHLKTGSILAISNKRQWLVNCDEGVLMN
jgi:hypothetical protein